MTLTYGPRERAGAIIDPVAGVEGWKRRPLTLKVRPPAVLATVSALLWWAAACDGRHGPERTATSRSGLTVTFDNQHGSAASFTPFVVSNSDLIAGQAPVASSTAANFAITGPGTSALTDGAFTIGSDQMAFADAGPGLADGPTQPQFVEYALGASPFGYDVSSIVVYGGWVAFGRDAQGFHVLYSLAGSPSTFIPLAAVDPAYQPPNVAGKSGTRIQFTGGTSPHLASGVARVRVVFDVPVMNNWSGYAEIDIFGAATAAPALILPTDPRAKMIYQTGFNDASGIGVDATAGSPYTLGQTVFGRGASEAWNDRAPGDTIWGRTTTTASVVQSAVKFEGDGALALGVGDTVHNFRDGGSRASSYWVDYRIRLNLAGSEIAYTSEWRFSSGQAPASISFGFSPAGDRIVVLQQTGGTDRVIGTWTADQWLRVTKFVDWPNKRTTIWLDGVPIPGGTASWSHPATPEIDEIRFFTLGSAHVDALAMYEEVDPGLQKSISYTLTSPARVSVLISKVLPTPPPDPYANRVVRELRHAAPRPAGPNTELWDGKDDSGQPVDNGTYRQAVARRHATPLGDGTE
jgi:hypothetical protein